MEIILWIASGAAFGAVAKLTMPGPDPAGIIGTVLLGMSGAAIGGLLGMACGFGTAGAGDLRGPLSGIVGALCVLLSYRCIAMRAPEEIKPGFWH